MFDRLEHLIRDTDKNRACLMSGNETLDVPRLPQVILEGQDVRRLKWAWGAPLHSKEVVRQKYDRRSNLRNPMTNWQVMSQESGNCPNYYELRRPGIAISFSFASATYGAFHALAWSASSLQKAEMILWRVAVIVLIGGLPLLLFWFCSTYPKNERTNPPLPQRVRSMLFDVIRNKRILRSMLLVCFLARVYLVVECFINLFHLPAAVFQTPNWSVYFPHIT